MLSVVKYWLRCDDVQIIKTFEQNELNFKVIILERNWWEMFARRFESNFELYS